MFKVNYQDAVAMNVVPTTSAADALQELMTAHQVTQMEFASHIAISQKQLSFILNRRAYMSIPVAKKIERATGLSAQWLLQLDLNYQLAHQKIDDKDDVKRFEWAAN